MMKEILYEILREAKEGKVEIDGEEWPVGFDSKIDGGPSYVSNAHNACLVVHEEEKFLKLLEEYVSFEMERNRKLPNFLENVERNRIKWILLYFFINSTTEDFLNPIDHLRRRIQFLKDDTFDYLKDGFSIPLSKNFYHSNLEVSCGDASIQQETPKMMEISFSKQDEELLRYHFPRIYYGIAYENGEKVCYIYSILNKNLANSLKEEKYHSKINRLLFQLNRDVKSLEEFLMDGEENIRDVSMSFVFSLNVFLSLLQSANISKIKVVPYLPLRYHSREMVARNSSLREELEKRNDRIQNNLTNKFIRTFRRLSYQNKSLEIVSYPYEMDEYLTVHLDDRQKELENMLLEEAGSEIYRHFK